ncbi:MAG: porin [Bacteroides sp.]|nr:porin [Bacteroides sp.]MCM1413362.1 porin [Bacteroides sp.]MCM1471952.1 porin [Bacteroides sp.]
MLKKMILVMAVALTAISPIHAGENTDSTAKINYMPNIHGTVRARFEASTEESYNRFQVRNARLSVDGKIAPFADYFIQADLCDRGKIKLMDAYARLWATPTIGIQAGQFLMPFAVAPFRSPHLHYFANRSFIGRDMVPGRAVGAKFMWHPERLPLTIEAGAFNPNTLTEQTTWHRELAYAAKLTFKLLPTLELTTGFQSITPDSVRINLVDAAAHWSDGRWTVEGEYVYKHYTNESHKAAHGYNIFADYAMPIQTAIFNRLSFQARFDGMTAHSSGTRTDGKLTTNQPARNRLTIGSTISYRRSKSMFIDLRADYEKYFYHEGVTVTPDMGDKIVVEAIIRF